MSDNSMYGDGVEEEAFTTEGVEEDFGFFIKECDPHPLNNICAFLTALAVSHGHPQVATDMIEMMQSDAGTALMKVYGANLAVIRNDGTEFGEMVEASRYKGIKKQIPFSAGGYLLDHLTKKGTVFIQEDSVGVPFFANERGEDIGKQLVVQTPALKTQKAFLLASMKIEYDPRGNSPQGTRRLHAEITKLVRKDTPAFSAELLARLEAKGMGSFPDVIHFEPLSLTAGLQWDYTQKLCDERIEPFVSSGMGGRAGAYSHMMHVFAVLEIKTMNPDMDPSFLPYGLKESEIMAQIMMVKNKGTCDLFVPPKGIRNPSDVLEGARQRKAKYALVSFKNVQYQEMVRFCTSSAARTMVPMGHFAQMRAIMTVESEVPMECGVTGAKLMGCYGNWSRSRLQRFYSNAAPVYPKPLKCEGKFYGGKVSSSSFTCYCSPSYGNLLYYPVKDVVACQCSQVFSAKVASLPINDLDKVFGLCDKDCKMHRYCPHSGFSCTGSAHGISIGPDGKFQVCAQIVMEESADADEENPSWI